MDPDQIQGFSDLWSDLPVIVMKKFLSRILRKLRLIYIMDYGVYYYQKMKNFRQNKSFIKKHPGVSMPPDYLIYESFQLDYQKYYTDSLETARWLSGLFSEHSPVYNINILDWGCGPARIVRHLPGLMGNNNVFFGTDYNAATIRWCRDHIPGVTFTLNGLEPPLDFSDGFFHIVYGISIFTHLSGPMHEQWIRELHRVLTPGGILLLTTQGAAFRQKLQSSELSGFDAGHLVVRGQVKEGHRTFSAFQPEIYFRRLCKEFEVVDFQPGSGTERPQQDVWILKKK